MANKIKIQNHIKKRRERNNFASGRKIDNRVKRRYYLIICEGEKTEPNYFKSLKAALPKGVLDVCEFNIDGTG